MKLLYVANIRIPTEKAHGAQIMKTCEALVRTGAKVDLVVTTRSTSVSEDPFKYYDVPKSFAMHRLWSADTVGWGSLGFLSATFSFAISAVLFLRKQAYDILYCRDEAVIWAMLVFGYRNIVWESHVGSWNFFARSVARRALAVIVISQGLKDFYIERGVPASKICVAHDGVDLSHFSEPETQDTARTRLGLPKDKKVAMYIGRLDGWKGADAFCAASEHVPGEVLLAVIGGEPEQIEVFAKKYPKVTFLGARPYRELADNQAAADILVLPNTGKDEISARFTSPLKLFTYMASGRPIVASDLPSIREVLSEKNAVLVKPDDPEAVAQGIQECFDNPERALALAAQARSDVEAYSWDARAGKILTWLK